jgi:uncharacterized protein
MRCAYCYYIAREATLPKGPGRLPVDLLEKYIQQRIQSSDAPVVHFEWHGGEPTLLGLDYFRLIVRLQRKHLAAARGQGGVGHGQAGAGHGQAPRGQAERPRPALKVSNGLQTNGLLIDGAWARFLATEGFSVGLSLDGSEGMHDACRRTARGGPTHSRVQQAYWLLKEQNVFVNILCVLQGANTGKPDEAYEYFRDLGVAYLQFLPLVPGSTGAARTGTAAAEPAAVGEFLCRVFDRWLHDGVGRMVIQNIDEAFRTVYGLPHALCVHRETCGEVAVLERDGGFYACDHFVDADHLIGNIGTASLGELASDPRMIQFGNAKRDTLPRLCRECDVRASCNGGCPKGRDPASNGEAGGVNRLCGAYRRFFTHTRSELELLAAHVRAGRALREYVPSGARPGFPSPFSGSPWTGTVSG